MQPRGHHERWLCRQIADQTPHAHDLQMALRVQKKGEKKRKYRGRGGGGQDPYQVKRFVGTDNTEYGLEHESIESQIQTLYY
jgi:hypothetical protein